MVKEKKTMYVILGLLSHEPMTGYDMKKRIDSTLKYFWSASFGSIYPALAELEAVNLVTKQAQPNERGREKLLYEITQSGRDTLKQWLEQPVEKDEMRYETLLKLFFGKEAGIGHSVELIQEFQMRFEEEIPKLAGAVEVLSKIPDEDGTHLYYKLTALFGMKIFHAYVEWAKEAQNILKEKEARVKS